MRGGELEVGGDVILDLLLHVEAVRVSSTSATVAALAEDPSHRHLRRNIDQGKRQAVRSNEWRNGSSDDDLIGRFQLIHVTKPSPV